jgi:hypothetical protein
MANGVMPQITADPSMPLENINVDQDMMVDNAVSRGPTVDGAALGGGAGEEAGEEAQEETGQVREEVNMGAEGNQVAQVAPHESTIVNHAASGEDALAGSVALGCNDFCTLFRVKVPVSNLLSTH